MALAGGGGGRIQQPAAIDGGGAVQGGRWRGGESILGVVAVGDSPRKALHGGDGSGGGEWRWKARPVLTGGD
jgi:hypothetical protein